MRFSRPVIFGEVLYDCFPDDTSVLGGAPFNVAWNCQAFGINPLFISRVGNDSLGRSVRSSMQDWGMDCSGLQQDLAHKTGVVDVSFEGGEPLYNIVENSAWDFIDETLVPEVDKRSILYHGSLALRSVQSANSLRKLKMAGIEAVFADLNLRSPWWNPLVVERITQTSRWLKLNEAELRQIVKPGRTIEAKMNYLLANSPVEIVIVTLGEDGALVSSRDEQCLVEPDRVVDVVDVVGAGDAFSSVLILGLYKQWNMHQTLERAQEFASAVVGLRGATTKDHDFYHPFISLWGL